MPDNRRGSSPSASPARQPAFDGAGAMALAFNDTAAEAAAEAASLAESLGVEVVLPPAAATTSGRPASRSGKRRHNPQQQQQSLMLQPAEAAGARTAHRGVVMPSSRRKYSGPRGNGLGQTPELAQRPDREDAEKSARVVSTRTVFLPSTLDDAETGNEGRQAVQ